MRQTEKRGTGRHILACILALCCFLLGISCAASADDEYEAFLNGEGEYFVEEFTTEGTWETGEGDFASDEGLAGDVELFGEGFPYDETNALFYEEGDLSAKALPEYAWTLPKGTVLRVRRVTEETGDVSLQGAISLLNARKEADAPAYTADNTYLFEVEFLEHRTDEEGNWLVRQEGEAGSASDFEENGAIYRMREVWPEGPVQVDVSFWDENPPVQISFTTSKPGVAAMHEEEDSQLVLLQKDEIPGSEASPGADLNETDQPEWAESLPEDVIPIEDEFSVPTETPTPELTEAPTPEPTEIPTPEPTEIPTPEPTEIPTPEPTETPTPEPTEIPTPEPTEIPTPEPTEIPTPEPTEIPTPEPTEIPTPEPTETPTPEPTEAPTPEPTEAPTPEPTEAPTPAPTETPIPTPTATPTLMATATPTLTVTPTPTATPTLTVTPTPTATPTLTVTPAPATATSEGPLQNGSAEIYVNLNLIGRSIEEEDQFTFSLIPDRSRAEDGSPVETPMPETDTVKATGNQAESFGTIHFSKAGTYNYLVKEDIPSGASFNEEEKYEKDGVVYDSDRHKVQILVSEAGGGKLSAQVLYDEQETGTLTFTNLYTEQLPDVSSGEVTKAPESTDTAEKPEKTEEKEETGETEAAKPARTSRNSTVIYIIFIGVGLTALIVLLILMKLKDRG